MATDPLRTLDGERSKATLETATAVQDVAISADGKWIAATMDYGGLALWQTDNSPADCGIGSAAHEQIGRGCPTTVGFTPDGQLI